eukprot:s587_g7.t1
MAESHGVNGLKANEVASEVEGCQHRSLTLNAGPAAGHFDLVQLKASLDSRQGPASYSQLQAVMAMKGLAEDGAKSVKTHVGLVRFFDVCSGIELILIPQTGTFWGTPFSEDRVRQEQPKFRSHIPGMTSMVLMARSSRPCRDDMCSCTDCFSSNRPLPGPRPQDVLRRNLNMTSCAPGLEAGPAVQVSLKPLEYVSGDGSGRFDCNVTLFDALGELTDSVLLQAGVDFFGAAPRERDAGAQGGNGSGGGDTNLPSTITGGTCATTCPSFVDVMCFVAHGCWDRVGMLLLVVLLVLVAAYACCRVLGVC